MTNHHFLRIKPLLITAVLLSGILMCAYSVVRESRTNGSLGFPLDDPWIHLQFAKNLHDFGSFSYYKNDMVTSGSTSPLFTMLLAMGFFVTSNEILLGYVMGVGFFALGGYYLFQYSLSEFEGSLLFASAAAFLMMFEPRLQWIALSGMETTLFVFLLIAVLYYYKKKETVRLGIACGLLLWTRPDAVIFIGAVVMDAVYHTWWAKHAASRKRSNPPESFWWIKTSLGIFSVFAVGYALFNAALSGTVLPNTYAAKVKYYSAGGNDFPAQVLHFLVDGHMLLLSIFSCVGLLIVFSGIIRRQPQGQLISFLWVAGLFLAYWRNLPYLYQEGRYLMPVLPFIILLGISGLRTAVEYGKGLISSLGRRQIVLGTHVLVLFVFGVQFVVASERNTKVYGDYCRYISQRQVRTAWWLHDRLPENAVIATHDVGAIGFYSGKRIADMVGLISPEMIDNIGNLDKLRQFLAAKKTTHLAVLRNWFEVANVNPIFQTDERFPEIMEVFEVDPAHVHFTPGPAGRMNAVAAYYLSAGDIQRAGPMLEQSLRIDPQSSRTHFLLANAFAAVGKLDEAEQELRTAINLHPSYWDAQVVLAQIAARRNKPDEAIARLEAIVKQNPSCASGYRALADIYASFYVDSAKSNLYLQRYHMLVQKGTR